MITDMSYTITSRETVLTVSEYKKKGVTPFSGLHLFIIKTSLSDVAKRKLSVLIMCLILNDDYFKDSTIALVSLAITISSSVAISSTLIFESGVESVPVTP